LRVETLIYTHYTVIMVLISFFYTKELINISNVYVKQIHRCVGKVFPKLILKWQQFTCLWVMFT